MWLYDIEINNFMFGHIFVEWNSTKILLIKLIEISINKIKNRYFIIRQIWFHWFIEDRKKLQIKNSIFFVEIHEKQYATLLSIWSHHATFHFTSVREIVLNTNLEIIVV